MSIKAITLVWEYAEAKGSELLLLLAMADYADDELGNIYPSIKTLAHKVRMTERNTQMLVRKLLDAGLLESEPGGGRGRTTVYAIRLMEKGENFSVKKPERVKNPVLKGEKSGTERVKPTSPDPLVEPSENPSAKIVPPHTRAERDALHDALVEGVGIRHRENDEPHISKVVTRLLAGEYTPEEVALACDVHHKEWRHLTISWDSIGKNMSLLLDLAGKRKIKKERLII